MATIEKAMPIIMALGEDIFVEVSHGPTLIDNNILLSDRSLKICSQGVAVVHNLIGGSLAAIGLGTDNGSRSIPSPRYTPYHAVHGTNVAGFMTILHGDSRFYNNVFVARKEIHPFKHIMEQFAAANNITADDANFTSGTFPYNGYPTLEEWKYQFENYCDTGSIIDGGSDRYYDHLPMWFGGNCFFNGSKPADKEEAALVDVEHEIKLEIICDGDKWKLDTNLFDYLPESVGEVISTDTLGMAFEPEQRFENPDGSAIIFDTDYFGKQRGTRTTAGPFERAEEIKELR
jgi:hypothetical protein